MNLLRKSLSANFLWHAQESRLSRNLLTVQFMSSKVETEPNEQSLDKLKSLQHRKKPSSPQGPLIPPNYRHVYPEFLPDPKVEWRNPVREKLERLDMLDRRTRIDIPEFYVGSIMAVTSSDPHSPGKVARFVGICIHREKCGLRSQFQLRNVVDHQGIEVLYDMYDPTIQKIEVLRLEKRLDDQLFYLRDALPEYSTFDFNMQAETLPEGDVVPVNPIKVILKPRPWDDRWERKNLKGVANIEELAGPKLLRLAKLRETPWEKYDLMKQYRATIPDEEQTSIYSEIYPRLNSLVQQRKIQKRKRALAKPTKKA